MQKFSRIHKWFNVLFVDVWRAFNIRLSTIKVNIDRKNYYGRRVVVTGMGLVSPLGCGVSHNWERLIKGESGIGILEHFDSSALSVRIGGEVPIGDKPGELNFSDYFEAKDLRRTGQFVKYGMVAAAEALKDANWFPSTEEEMCESGVMVGAGIGGLPEIYDTAIALYEKGPNRISPFFIPSSLINLTAGNISIKYKLKGPNHASVTACSSGSHAIGDAMRMIKCGDANVMLAGGAESSICSVGVAGFAIIKALASGKEDCPEIASCPYDEARSGFVIGEGSGLLVLEELEHAKKRGAKIYCELVGYGMSSDAYHMTAPDENGDGAYRAMKSALRDAELIANDIDYINGHGTSTPLGDLAEVRAVLKLFGRVDESIAVKNDSDSEGDAEGDVADDHVSDDANANNADVADVSTKPILMSSIKSCIGHALGAAGSIEAAICCLALCNQMVPPTRNIKNPITSMIDFIPQAKKAKLKYVMSNSFGFGGTNSALIFKEYDGRDE